MYLVPLGSSPYRDTYLNRDGDRHALHPGLANADLLTLQKEVLTKEKTQLFSLQKEQNQKEVKT